MSTDQNFYVIVGVPVSDDLIDMDRDIAEIEGRPGAEFDMIYDSMAGERHYAGKILGRMSDYSETIDEVDLSAKFLETAGPFYLQFINKMRDRFGLELEVEDIKFLLVRNYS